MRKLLQVMTIVLLVLSAAALFLGSLLFSKRELLKGRTQALEKALVQLSAIIEAPVEAETKLVGYPERDIADVTAQPVATPETTTFWQGYPAHLEDVDKPFASVRAEDLMHYYKLDPITQKIEKDPATGYPIMKGEGTMDATIQGLLGAAQYQLDILNQTRAQLTRVREELIVANQDVNERKQRLRQALAEINTLNGTISGLQDDVRRLEGQVADLESEKRNLEDTIAQQEKQIEEQTEEIRLRDETIAQQRQRINDLVSNQKASNVVGKSFVDRQVEAGQKGRVVSVNQDWTYVVIELDDQFLAELEALKAALSKNETPGIPTVDLFLKRGDKFVAKVKLVQIKSEEKLGIADVLVDWQQMPVLPGDMVFY